MPPKRRTTAPAPTSPKPPKRRKKSLSHNPSPSARPPKRLAIRGYTSSDTNTSTDSDSSLSGPALPPAPESSEDEDDDEEDIQWEDVTLPSPAAPSLAAQPSGNLELDLTAAPTAGTSSTRKGPTALERRTRLLTHMLHVISLLHRCRVLNLWAGRKEIMARMLSHLPDRKSEWKMAALMRWWRKRFRIMKEGERRGGYRSLRKCKEMIDGWKAQVEGEEGDAGWEKVVNAAEKCEGSRDEGALLFVALLRALGHEARLCCSLQALGFGFSSMEEAKEEDDPAPQEQREQSPNSDSSSSLSSVPSSFSSHKFDSDLPVPILWAELLSSNGVITAVDPFTLHLLANTPQFYSRFQPPTSCTTQVIAYISSFCQDGYAKDVTTRYLSQQRLPGRTKGHRVPIRLEEITDWAGNVVAIHKTNWFGRVIGCLGKPDEKKSEAEKAEDALLEERAKEKERKGRKEGAESLSTYKNHPLYILESTLKREEALREGAEPVKTLTIGKGAKKREEKLFSRQDVLVGRTVENWYREGRKIIPGMQPVKLVKRRAVTLTRKREIEERKKSDGGDVMQGLYTIDQTELYIPPPIQDGIIPRNEFGNIDVYVSTMIPEGAVHLPLKGVAKVAKHLGVSYAEAVTGFDFRKQRAVPFVEGIVVASENKDLIRDAWRAEERERIRKEKIKRERTALERWRVWLRKLRILERVREAHGDMEEGVESNPFVRRKEADEVGGLVGGGEAEAGDESEAEGGFLREGNNSGTGGFLRENSEDSGGGGFLLDDEGDVGGKKEREEPAQKSRAKSLHELLKEAEGHGHALDEDSEEEGEQGQEQERGEAEEEEGTRSEYFVNPPPPKKRGGRGKGKSSAVSTARSRLARKAAPKKRLLEAAEESD